MSNDEYKTSLVNYSRFYFGRSTLKYNNDKNLYQSVFSTKPNDHLSVAFKTTPSAKKPAYETDDVNETKSIYSRASNKSDTSVISSEFVPMNLITHTGLDLSQSVRKPTFAAYFNDEALTHKNSSHISSRCSSTSPSIDVENDDSADRIMSPVSIPSHHQPHFLNDTRSTSQSAFTNMELTAGSITSGFPLNYHQYANNAALYGAPVMFSGAIHAAHASYMAGLPLHAALSPNDTYLKAIQAAACGIYSPTALAPPPPTPSTSAPASVNSTLITGKLSSLRSPTVSPMMALSPCSQPVGTAKTPQQQQYPQTVVNSITEIEQQQQKKKEYHATPLNSQITLTTSNSAGTYLNDKVNERLTGVDATTDSHFKVPNGKEGSLKHRILRPSSQSDGGMDQCKTSVMRSYSTTSNFRKGNYIELANGTLRRIEDMRTEDFIQCAERSPHHQLAESTVVKINTSLPATAVITFSYDRNRAKVDMEVSVDHPFFVYGQGWASCNPEMSIKMFGLKCQRLQVGDICISLTKREQFAQQTPTQNNSQLNEAVSYQAKNLALSSNTAAHLKPHSLTTINSEMPYSATLNTHTFSIPLQQPNHHMQGHQQQHHHQVQQQAYAEMAKLMSSYAYAKRLPQQPHEQLKETIMDSVSLQNMPPKIMSNFYQNQIFQYAQHHQHKQLGQPEQHRVSNTNYNVISSLNSSPNTQPSDLGNSHMHQQPPQTQPLDVTMSRKRRWSAPENMFDDDEADPQPPRNRSSPATART